MATIRLQNAISAHPDYQFAAPINFLVADGKNVAIVGGGNTAAIEALPLAKYAAKVYITGF